MKIKIFFFGLLCVIISAASLSAQGRMPELTSSSKKAVKHYEKAAYLYTARHLPEALTELDEALKIDAEFIESWLMKGDILSDMNQKDQAIVAYLKAIGINEKFFVNTYANVANLELKTGKYADAKKHFIRFLELAKSTPERQAPINKLIESCDFAIDAM